MHYGNRQNKLVTLLGTPAHNLRNTLYMAHMTKADKRRLVAIRTDMVAYLRDLMLSVHAGDIAGVIDFVNNGSVAIDVSSLLKRDLTRLESVSLLLTPEDTGEAYGARFGQAHMIATNMKAARMLCRGMLRQGRIEGIGPQLAELLGSVEAYAF